ncbi:MAG: glycine cleavage system protein GcvH [Proteobacteria bacterium]|nr:glycine cleavage system protein GcvH [Pseudomonadota bacterium]
MADYDLPDECRYTEHDEWVRMEMDGARLVVGITDYAQQELGDIVYVELPSVAEEVRDGQPFGVIESVKAVSDLYSPAAGTVVAVNEVLADRPELVNEDCYGEGWLVAIEGVDAEVLDSLMDANAYRKYVASRAE